MTPFLHALVKSTDFYLQVQERTTASNRRLYITSVRSAISQKIPDKLLLWDRVELEFTKELTPAQLDAIIRDSPVMPKTI